MGTGNPPALSVFEERKQSRESAEDDGRDRVSGKCFGASFSVFFQRLDLITNNRYRMIPCTIRILNAKTPWTTIRTTGLIIYFCTVTFHFMPSTYSVGRKLFEVSLHTNYLGSLPRGKKYTCFLESDTVNHLTLDSAQGLAELGSWARQFPSAGTCASLTLSSPLTQHCRRAGGYSAKGETNS